MTAALTFHYSPMNSGKSTLALQFDFNLRGAGRTGLRFTCLDRSGRAVISSRLGIEADAIEVTPDTDILAHVEAALARGEDISYVLADEAQFYTSEQIDQLADIVDTHKIAVSAFGLITDFTSTLFPGTQRLFEVADQHIPLQVRALCWCGETARMNARIVNGVLVTEGEQVVVGDVADDDIRYVLLCRPHFKSGQHQRLAAVPTMSTHVA